MIARATGLDRKTVRRYLAAAHDVDAQTPLTGAVVHEVADVVQARPAPEPSEPRLRLTPHRTQVERWLNGTHDGSDGRALRLTKVHTLLARQGIEVTYAMLRRYVIDELGWRKRTPTGRVDDPATGDEAQIDFGYMGMLHDETTGRARKLWGLVVTLTCSRYQFVWPTFSQTTEALCEGLDAAWSFFDGVPGRWVAVTSVGPSRGLRGSTAGRPSGILPSRSPEPAPGPMTLQIGWSLPGDQRQMAPSPCPNLALGPPSCDHSGP